MPIVISLCLTGCLKKIEKQIELGRFYLEKTHSRAVSFEEQVSLVRESLAKAFEVNRVVDAIDLEVADGEGDADKLDDECRGRERAGHAHAVELRLDLRVRG